MVELTETGLGFFHTDHPDFAVKGPCVRGSERSLKRIYLLVNVDNV